MPTINQLPTVTQVSGGDQLPLYVTNQGDARRCSVTTLLEYFSQNFASPDYETIINAPTNSGFNINLGQQSNNVFLILNPTGTFAAGSVTLPPVASCFDGQEIVLVSSAAVENFTIVGNGSTVIGAPAGLIAGGGFTLRFSAVQDTWYCIASSEFSSVVNVRDFGALGNGITDDTVAIQAAIDSLPATGGSVFFPTGTYMVSTIRGDGSAGGKTNVSLYGEGSSSHIKKLANSAIATVDGKRNSVIQFLTGNNHAVRNLKIEGNNSRGGLVPNYGSVWTPNTTYTFTGNDDVAYSTQANGTTVAPGNPYSVAVANGGRVFLLAQTHTSGPSSILADLALGYWVEVTNQPFDELTGTGYFGYWESDDDYAHRHGIYANGTTSAMDGVIVENCEVTDAVYGGIVVGSGPLFANQKYFGTINGRIADCYAYDNRGSNIGGGYAVSKTVVGNTTKGGTSSGIRFDEGCDNSVISGNTIIGEGTADNGGVLVYKSKGTVVSGNAIIGALPGIWIYEATEYSVTGNNIESASAGIAVINSLRGTVQGNTVFGSTQYGIGIRGGNSVTVSGNISHDNGGVGILIKNTGAVTVASNVCSGNVSAGIEVNNSAGIIVTGNRCFEPMGVSGPQQYGVIETGTSIKNVVISNQCSDNAIGPTSLAASTTSFANASTSPILSAAVDFTLAAAGVNMMRATNTILTLGGLPGNEAIRAEHNANAVNHLKVRGGVLADAGGSIAISADGSEANIDLRFIPKGAGLMRFGALTGTADTPISGYIEIKDVAGTIRKLAVIS